MSLLIHTVDSSTGYSHSKKARIPILHTRIEHIKLLELRCRGHLRSADDTHVAGAHTAAQAAHTDCGARAGERPEALAIYSTPPAARYLLGTSRRGSAQRCTAPPRLRLGVLARSLAAAKDTKHTRSSSSQVEEARPRHTRHSTHSRRCHPSQVNRTDPRRSPARHPDDDDAAGHSYITCATDTQMMANIFKTLLGQ